MSSSAFSSRRFGLRGIRQSGKYTPLPTSSHRADNQFHVILMNQRLRFLSQKN